MGDYDSGEYEAAGYDAGPVQLEFVDGPALNGEDVEFSFRTVGGRTAPSGTVVAQVAVMRDHNLLGGGTTSVHSELGPHDIGASRIHPLQYTAEDGDYQLSITIGSDVRSVSYRVHDHHVQAI
jgi:hypothetical protein